MVAAFEQSLLAMTARLQQQTALSEHKDSELKMLKMLVDELNECRRRGDEANATAANGRSSHGHSHRDKSKERKKEKAMKKGALIRRHTFASGSEELKEPPQRSAAKITHDRDHSQTHVNTDTTNIKEKRKSDSNVTTPTDGGTSLKSGGWFRSSLNRFRKNKANASPVKMRSGSCSQLDGPNRSEVSSLPASPVHIGPPINGSSSESPASTDLLIDKLRDQLSKKDCQLTDLRLDALASAHQLDSLNESLAQFRREAQMLREENCQLRSMLGDISSGKIQNTAPTTRSNSVASVSVTNNSSHASSSPDER